MGQLPDRQRENLNIERVPKRRQNEGFDNLGAKVARLILSAKVYGVRIIDEINTPAW